MHVDKLHAGHSSRAKHGSRDGIGNIVEFQIEENAVAKRRDLFDGFRTGAGEKLVANLEHANQVGNFLGKLQRRRQRVKVQGYDQTAARMSVEGHCFGDLREPVGGQCFLGTSKSSSRTWLTPEWIKPIFRATR